MHQPDLTNHQRSVVESEVASLLGRSHAFRALPADQRAGILSDTAALVETMATSRQPAVADPFATSLAMAAPVGSSAARRAKEDFGTGTKTGVQQTGQMLREVDFPAFVSALVKGVFHSIVESSIEQMRAYAELVKSVSMSLNDFRDQNVSENQARDHLASRYPNLFQVQVSNGNPRIRRRPGIDEDMLPDFQRDLGLSEPISDLDDETIERTLLPAARNDLARGRQQLLATMVLMGINRIVVTDGRINAKVRFTFTATDNLSQTATEYDYRNLGNTDVSIPTGGTAGGDRYATGQYMRVSTPNIQLMSDVTTQTDANLVTSGDLRGEVSINFKSETFPLEKMVNTQQMQQLEEAQRTGLRGTPPAAGAAPAPGSPAPAGARPAPTAPVQA